MIPCPLRQVQSVLFRLSNMRPRLRRLRELSTRSLAVQPGVFLQKNTEF